jgi:hypothetical protein
LKDEELRRTSNDDRICSFESEDPPGKWCIMGGVLLQLLLIKLLLIQWSARYGQRGLEDGCNRTQINHGAVSLIFSVR